MRRALWLAFGVVALGVVVLLGLWRSSIADAAIWQQKTTALLDSVAAKNAALAQFRRDRAAFEADRTRLLDSVAASERRALRIQREADRSARARDSILGIALPLATTAQDTITGLRLAVDVTLREVAQLRDVVAADAETIGALRAQLGRDELLQGRMDSVFQAQGRYVMQLEAQLRTAEPPCRLGSARPASWLPCPSRTVLGVGALALGVGIGRAL